MLRAVLLGAAILLVLLVALVARERITRERWRSNPGHGYWSVQELVPNSRGSWERFAHYERLFDGRVDLGLVWGHSVSPNGSFAVLERDGVVLVYDRQQGVVDTVASGQVDEGGFRWDAAAKTLGFKLATGRGTVVRLASRP